MKKFLSLVLALVMTMSLVTISAGAKDFTDASKINYDEAVDVVSALKIVEGDTTGAFNPQGGLTRGAAAKIICNLILGPTTASALNADAAPFKDVPVNHTYAGYIAYCSQQGIISGYANGTFRPAAPLTGYAFMKMLLGALGYDAAIEGYVGPNWSIAVAKRALNIGLDKGLDDDFVGTKALTREEAALYVLNTLKATMVEYDNTIIVGEVTIAGSKAQDVVNNAAASKQFDGKNDGKMQFCEKYFSNLKMDSDATDAFMRPATTWTLKSKTIGTYADTPDVVYTAATKIGTIYADLGLSKGIADEKVTAYVDGQDAVWNNDIVKGSLTKMGGAGEVMEVYYDSGDNSAIIVMVNTYIGKIAAAYPDSTTKDAYVKVKDLDGYGCPGAGKEFKTESFKKDDIVRYTYSYKTGEEQEIKSMELVEEVTGAMSTYTISGNVTVGGTKYTANTASVATVIDAFSAVDKGDDVTIYLDANGYVLYVDADVDVKYAVVLNYQANTGDMNDETKAKLLFTDGTTKIVEATTQANIGDFTGTITYAEGELDIYDIVSYTIGTDNVYELTLVSNATQTANGAAGGTKLVTNGKNIFADKTVTNNADVNLLKAGTETKYADAETIFLVMTPGTGTKKDTFAAYKGFANVPTMTLASGEKTTMAVFMDSATDNDPADLVFVLDTDKVAVSSNNKDIIYIKGSGVDKSYTNALGHFYEYDCFVNGDTTATTIKTENAFTKDTLVYGPSYNAKGILIGQDAYADETGVVGDYIAEGTVTYAVKNGVIKLGGVSYAYEKDCEVYFIDVDGNLVPGSIDEIAYDEDDQVYVKTNIDGRLTDVYIKVIDGADEIPALENIADIEAIDLGDGLTKYVNTTYYVADGRTLSQDAMLAALIAEMKKDGCTDISLDGTTLSYKLGGADKSVTVNSLTQVYKVTVTANTVTKGNVKFAVAADTAYVAKDADYTVTLTATALGNTTDADPAVTVSATKGTVKAADVDQDELTAGTLVRGTPNGTVDVAEKTNTADKAGSATVKVTMTNADTKITIA